METLAMGCIALLITFVFQMVHSLKVDWIKLLLIPILAYIIFKFKFYYIAVLAPVLIAYSVIYVLKEKFKIQIHVQLILFLALLILGGLVVSTLHPLLHLNSIAASIYENYQATIAFSMPGNYYQFEGLKPTISSIITHFPQALISGLFRPSIFDIHNLFGLITALENLLITVLAIAAVIGLFKNTRLKDPLIVMAVATYIMILASLLALASPNFGTLARYKVSFLPFLILLLLEGNTWIKLLFQKGKA